MNVLYAIGKTPLVELSAISRGLPVPIFAKCEHLNPGGSVKDRIARAIVDDAEARSLISPGATLIEATAGNTGMGLALVAAARGYRLVCTMPATANPRVHEETTGPEILAHVTPSAFVAGVGTGGTITGVARALRGRARIVLADPIGSMLADFIEKGHLDGDGPYLVEGIGGSEIPDTFDTTLVHAVERISDDESFATARRLWREEGLFVGGSAGTNVAAAIRVARTMTKRDNPVVTILPDSWDRYRSAAWFTGR